jgi:hypothetical protein
MLPSRPQEYKGDRFGQETKVKCTAKRFENAGTRGQMTGFFTDGMLRLRIAQGA